MSSIKYLTILILFISCGQKQKQPATENKIDEKAFFDFDKIIHYSIDISNDSVLSLHENRDKSRRNMLLDNILIQYGDEHLADTAFLNSLDDLPFNKVIIDPSKFPAIKNIFREKKHEFPVYYACAAIWRDILIFKKSESTIGIAKLCFDCNRYSIVGAKANTDEFGQDGDFEKLYALLKKK